MIAQCWCGAWHDDGPPYDRGHVMLPPKPCCARMEMPHGRCSWCYLPDGHLGDCWAIVPREPEMDFNLGTGRKPRWAK